MQIVRYLKKKKWSGQNDGTAKAANTGTVTLNFLSKEERFRMHDFRLPLRCHRDPSLVLELTQR